jgi:CheY-like chemotaxis protein/glycine cleavage system H lipoate-binding protein
MPERVLVVDDEEVVLSSVRKALRLDDLEVDTVQTAEEALARLAGCSYALVITDLMMPGMDGLELLRRLHGMNRPPEAIMITGYPTIRTALLARRLGAFEYVTKPFTRQELRSAVVRALRKLSGAGESEPSPAMKEGNLYIPGHAWVRLEQDGSARVGLAFRFAEAVGDIAGVRLPSAGELVEQGRSCATIRASDEVEHFVYCPLSGRVSELNRAVERDPSLIRTHPEAEGWLFRLDPLDPDRETPNLVRG